MVDANDEWTDEAIKAAIGRNERNKVPEDKLKAYDEKQRAKEQATPGIGQTVGFAQNDQGVLPLGVSGSGGSGGGGGAPAASSAAPVIRTPAPGGAAAPAAQLLPRKWIGRIGVWGMFLLAFVVATLQAVYTCTWLGEYEYNVQIAKHTFILFWLAALTMCFNYPVMCSPYYVFPGSDTVSYFIIGLANLIAVAFMLANPTLVLLYRGNRGVHITSTTGTRVLPQLDPRQLFDISIGLCSAMGGIALLFWCKVLHRWVTNAEAAPG